MDDAFADDGVRAVSAIGQDAIVVARPISTWTDIDFALPRGT